MGDGAASCSFVDYDRLANFLPLIDASKAKYLKGFDTLYPSHKNTVGNQIVVSPECPNCDVKILAAILVICRRSFRRAANRD
jgi:hypothetical protein